jgi:hypothetical protein
LAETIEHAAASAAGNAEKRQPEAMTEEPKRIYAQCPCGAIPEQLVLEVPQQGKIGRASCATCGTWGVEFLRGVSQEPEMILDKAHAAWDAAPRQES